MRVPEFLLLSALQQERCIPMLGSKAHRMKDNACV